MKKIAYVGIDYHQAFLAVVVLPEVVAFPQQKVQLDNDPKKIKKYMDKLSEQYDIKTCYEASSCGYVFYRKMQEWGYSCQVVAPSKIPTKPGDHVKTDFKDAENLAYQFRNGSLTARLVPTGLYRTSNVSGVPQHPDRRAGQDNQRTGRECLIR